MNSTTVMNQFQHIPPAQMMIGRSCKVDYAPQPRVNNINDNDDDDDDGNNNSLFGIINYSNDYTNTTTTTTTTASILQDDDVFNELDSFINTTCSSPKYLASPPSSPLLSPSSFEEDEDVDYTDFPLFP